MLVDSLVLIEFWDHCRGLPSPVLCRAVGWVYADEDGYITLTSWRSAPGCLADDNDLVSIVRSCVVAVRALTTTPTKELPMGKCKGKGKGKGGK